MLICADNAHKHTHVFARVSFTADIYALHIVFLASAWRDNVSGIQPSSSSWFNETKKLPQRNWLTKLSIAKQHPCSCGYAHKSVSHQKLQVIRTQ